MKRLDRFVDVGIGPTIEHLAGRKIGEEAALFLQKLITALLGNGA